MSSTGFTSSYQGDANYCYRLIVLAVYSLCIGHPGLVFNEKAGLAPGNQTHDVERQNGIEK